LMYSHDTYGLGHIRRTMAIANHLRGTNTNILILTGSPIAGRFALPSQVDFVRIPGMIKKTNDEYRSLSIKIDDEQALNIRTNIILATAQTFKPDLFIVDKEPLGLKREVLPTLEWLKTSIPASRAVLGLRDILDDPSVIIDDWREREIYRYLSKLYDEIWVYGNEHVYNPVVQYEFPEEIAERVIFTGYIPRKKKQKGVRTKIRRRYRILDNDIFLLVTTGGGGDGYGVLDRFVAMHDYFPTTLPFKSLIITGPFMPKKKREQIKRRGRYYGIKTLPFHSRLEELIQAADLVISMGGYNTICEILSQQTPALIIPRETPRKEQLIRAQRLKEQNLIDYLGWHEITPQLLRDKIFSILEQADHHTRAMATFKLTGLDTMLERLKFFRAHNGNGASAETAELLGADR
jgi:predicted glycosyltransferase